KDGQHPIVLMNLGEVRYVSSRTNTVAEFAQKVFFRFTGFSMPEGKTIADAAKPDPPSIQEIFNCVYTNEERNRLILADILEAHHGGRECLVLSERLEHLDILKCSLEKQVSSLFVLKGGYGKKQVKAIMESIHNTPSDQRKIILATGKYLGEGFDLPCLDTLFLVFPFSWKGTLVQYTGRLNRAYHGKQEIRVYDYVDDKVPVLVRMHRRRLKGYKSLGFTAE
ncbi:MAG: restriction endonuclease subunit R, partial [Treponema sp.]|nr:restriction endonuclease subunit R [Treponema sp.]